MNSFFAKIIGANEKIRVPHFAGSWYPSQTAVLDKDMSKYLDNAKATKSDTDNILALIAPHAGYMFSGQTAAFAYRLLSSNKYKRVFLLGPSHHVPFKGAVLPNEDIFETPLGELIVDKATVNKLLQKPYFNEGSSVFDTEHSLEMQLPWIRKTLGKIKLIPIAIGMVGATEIKQIADAIKSELADSDLVIVSSDFTHYGPRFDYQPFSNEKDQTHLQAKIKELDLQAFNCLKTCDSQTLLDFYSRTGDTICGIFPAAVLLSLLPAGTQAKLLSYRTSQDFDKDPDGNSVTYMSIVFTAKDQNWSKASKSIKTPSLKPFTEAESKALLKLARLTLQDYLQGKRKDPLGYAGLIGLSEARLCEKHGVFITLYKKTTNPLPTNEHKQLRGCIGYIYPNKTLLSGISENAINAATKDPRFDPVNFSELNDLIIEISILTAPHYIADWQEINLGKDGIVLHKAGRQAVFLPKVATEFGWDLPQTLSQLSIKAGLSLYDWQKDAQFEIFQSQSFSE